MIRSLGLIFILLSASVFGEVTKFERGDTLSLRYPPSTHSYFLVKVPGDEKTSWVRFMEADLPSQWNVTFLRENEAYNHFKKRIEYSSVVLNDDELNLSAQAIYEKKFNAANCGSVDVQYLQEGYFKVTPKSDQVIQTTVYRAAKVGNHLLLVGFFESKILSDREVSKYVELLANAEIQEPAEQQKVFVPKNKFPKQKLVNSKARGMGEVLEVYVPRDEIWKLFRTSTNRMSSQPFTESYRPTGKQKPVVFLTYNSVPPSHNRASKVFDGYFGQAYISICQSEEPGIERTMNIVKRSDNEYIMLTEFNNSNESTAQVTRGVLGDNTLHVVYVELDDVKDENIHFWTDLIKKARLKRAHP